MTAVEPADVAARVLSERAQRDVNIGVRTTYRVGGDAALFVQAESEDDLTLVREAVTASGLPVLVIGRGSNLLVADTGFAGIAVVLGEAFASIDVLEASAVRAGGAVQLPVLARRTAAAGLTGLEWAVGVPGSVGGAVRMNAGGHGAETAMTLRRFRFVDLSGTAPDGDADAARLELSYRRSTVASHHVVVWGEFQLRPGQRAASEQMITEIVHWRRQNQPGGQNAGSIFTNPPADSAGRLIEAAGLKGLRVGTAEVSRKHANFFQADEGGSADDVYALILEVQRLVEERTGVRLATELRLVGFHPPPGPPEGR